MTFNDAVGKKYSISVNGVKSDISSEEVNSLMELIISSQVFVDANGLLISKAAAKTVDTQESEITVA